VKFDASILLSYPSFLPQKGNFVSSQVHPHHEQHTNLLLSALPEQDYRCLIPDLEYVTYNLGDSIYEPGARQNYIYFPTTCIVSLFYTTENGMTCEVGLIGNEGAVGISLFMGVDSMINQAVVQLAGGAFRMRADTLQMKFRLGGEFQCLLLRYTLTRIIQVSQTAVCNRLHSVEQRLCRWLLLCHDRVQSDDLAMTQEFIANMLGSRREGVTAAAGRLQDAGLINYNRGKIKILDRASLEAQVCECYGVVRREYERILGTQIAVHSKEAYEPRHGE
jgi:CRP-like cAMP-binding protein